MQPSVAEHQARPLTESGQTTPCRRGLPAWLIALALAVIALIPRCLGLADFFTIDEPYHWIGRVRRFAEALGRGDWAATDLTGHPGVTTMWLGALGRQIGQLMGVRDLGGVGAGAAYLATLRLPLAVANGLAVAVGYLVLRRLLRPSVALLASLLWATSPFLIAHSRLLHLDALLTSFMTLSVLLLLVATMDDGRWTTDDRRPAMDSHDRGLWSVVRGPIMDSHDRGLWSVVRGPWSLVGSGVGAGLALLTKAPSLFLLPFAGLLLFATTTDDRRPTTDDRRPTTDDGGHRGAALQGSVADQGSVVDGRWSVVIFRRLRAILPIYLLWLGVAALVVVALWPAMWVAPLTAIGDVYHEIVANGGEPEPAGNFFLGQAVAAPGWLFYPAVLLWRTTPLTLLGLALLPLALRRPTTDDRRPTTASTAATEAAATEGPPYRFSVLHSRFLGARRSVEQRVLLALLAFALLFGLMMSIEPKKYDRYLLPIWPALEILAAAGLGTGFDILLRRMVSRGRWAAIPAATSTTTAATEGPPYKRRWLVLGSRFSVLSWGIVGAVMAAPLAWYHPYELAYFNPLLGGGATAQRVMLVGWGEGMDQIGAWLRARPDLKRGPVLSWIPPTLAPFVPAAPGVLDLRTPLLDQPSSYAVLYARSVQRQESAIAEAYVRQTPPLFTLRMHGIEYATIHQLPRPFETPLDALFGDGLHLRGFSQRREGDTLTITPSWDVQADQPGGRFCFVHVLGLDGKRVAQVDALLDQGMFPAWQAGQQFDTPFPLQLPGDLSPGQYRVVIGVYTPAGGRLPLRRRPAAPAELDGPNALLVTTLTVP